MALKITEECVNCDACVPECPNSAISEGEDIFIIDPNLCTECVGFNEDPACVAACPVDSCVDDDTHKETESSLLEKARKLHPDQDFGDKFPSRYRD